MNRLKRDPVKYIRDRIKSKYKKGSSCRICGSTENLEFHHFHSVAELWKGFKSQVPHSTVEEMEVARDLFLGEFEEEMLHATVTLCAYHHARLHKVYGKHPPLRTAGKQEAWVEKQRTKAQES